MCCVSTCVLVEFRNILTFLDLSTSLNMCFVSINVLVEFRKVCLCFVVYLSVPVCVL